MISTAQQIAECNENLNSISHNSAKSKDFPQIMNNDDLIKDNNNAQCEDISLQKRQSWFEGSAQFSTRTTASNSTEISNISLPLNLNALILFKSESQQRENVFVQNAVFSEEDFSSQPSQTQLQDLVPFFNLLKQDKNHSNILRQSDDWNSQEGIFLFGEQSNHKDVLGLLDEKILFNGAVKSENFIPECQSAQELNTIAEEQEIGSIVLEEIKKLEQQQDEDESQSPTLKLKRVKSRKDNTIEERIYRWLDINGIFQVDPSQKREEYYQQKRETLISMKKVSKPLEEDMKQSSGSLNLCKISSSPLFNRRKQINKEPKKKAFLEINSDVDDQSIASNMNSSQFSELEQNICENIQRDSQYSQKSKFQNLQIKHKQNDILTYENSENTEDLLNKITLQVPSENQICSNFCESTSYSNKYSAYKDENIKTNDDELNIILPKQNQKLLSLTSMSSISEISNNKPNQNDSNYEFNMRGEFSQDNINNINHKHRPCLKISKNQKISTIKAQNSIPELHII